MFKHIALVTLLVTAASCASHAQNICSNQTPAAGWITTHIFSSGSCTTGVMKTVNYIGGESFASTETGLCNDGLPIPAGWIPTGFGTSLNCATSGFGPTFDLKNLNNAPTGTAPVTACIPVDTLPPGWVITDTPTVSACGGTGSGRTLLFMNGKGVGVNQAICPITASIPPGWTITGTTSGQSVCGGTIETIHNTGQGNSATIKTNGNFVVQSSSGSVLFQNSESLPTTVNYSVWVQDDGDLVEYQPVWSPSPSTIQTQVPISASVSGCKGFSLLSSASDTPTRKLAPNQCLASSHGRFMLYMGGGRKSGFV